jgi:hypothetical protein
MECKSLLDSPGVPCSAFDGKNPEKQRRYKLFFDDTLRSIVLKRLEQQFVAGGFCQKEPTVSLGLAAGKIYGSEDWLRLYFEKKGWPFMGPTQIRTELRALRECGYENTIAAIVAKLLLRNGSAS